MDRLVDEAEGLGVDCSPSVCSSSGRMEPIPDQQLSILNSITASDLTGKETCFDFKATFCVSVFFFLLFFSSVFTVKVNEIL